MINKLLPLPLDCFFSCQSVPLNTNANSLIKNYAKNNEKVFFIDTATPMIGKNGKPKSDLFVKDSLHLNSNGYDLWSSEVNSFLDSLDR